MAELIVQEAMTFLSQPLEQPIAELSFLRQALLFAEIAKLSYFRHDLVTAAAPTIGLDHVEFLDRDGAQAYILSHQHDCIVVCRGMEPHEWNDIKADVDALSVLGETVGRVHRGFKREVDDLWPRLEKSLREEEKTLYFTGHSLGGAMATICGGRCKLSEIPSNPEALFTFGSPRVGNKRYINFVKMQHYRWVNNNDIVCRVPLAWMGYSHAGREFYFDAFGRLQNYTSFRRLRDQFHGFLLTLRKWQIDHLSDHPIDRYIDCVSRAVEEEESGKTKPVLMTNPATTNKG